MIDNTQNMQSKSVRIFCELTLKYANPQISLGNSAKKKRTRTAIAVQENFCEGLCQELEALLEPCDIQIAFDRQTGIQQLNNQPSECLIPFLVSKLFEFGAEKIITSVPGRVGFKVKPDVFLVAQNELLHDIREKLAGKATIEKLAFATATSRIFIFEIYYEGSFKLKREFIDNEIKTAGGVGQALEDFFSEVEQSLEESGINVICPANKKRRSRNNEYSFEFTYQPTIGFSEDEVYGAGCHSVRGEATLDEINGYGVDFEDVRIDDAKMYLRSSLEDALYSTDLVSSEIYYIDDPEEIFDIDDEIILR